MAASMPLDLSQLIPPYTGTYATEAGPVQNAIQPSASSNTTTTNTNTIQGPQNITQILAPSTTSQNPCASVKSQSNSIATWHRITRKTTEEDLLEDLNVKRINKIHKHLWWVGRPGNVNTLHRQKAMLRTIVVTEKPTHHLVWFDFTIFIKPLPEYLLDREFFEKYICKDEKLYELACGFLLSYSKLILYKSDHKIAIDEGLIPEYMDWPTWCKFSADIRRIEVHTVNKRYRYGELRLGRLNQIYRYCLFEIRGFYTFHTTYNHFFQKNFGWLLLLFAFLTIILTGMQVVLATPLADIVPEHERLLNDVSYVFGIISIIIVAIGSFVALLVFLVLFWWNLVVTLLYGKKYRYKRRTRERNIREGKDPEEGIKSA